MSRQRPPRRISQRLPSIGFSWVSSRPPTILPSHSWSANTSRRMSMPCAHVFGGLVHPSAPLLVMVSRTVSAMCMGSCPNGRYDKDLPLVCHTELLLRRCQYLYLIFGPITMLWGIIVFFTMPSSPMSAWFLTPRERKIAVVRVRTPLFAHDPSYFMTIDTGDSRCFKITRVFTTDNTKFTKSKKPSGILRRG